MKIDQFTDQTVIVTGAGSGMGAASAREFARLGADLILVDINADSVQETAQQTGGYAIVGDLSEPQFCDAIVAETMARNQRLDVLVNAAGTIHRANALATSNQDWAKVMGVNVNAVFFLCRAALPPMIQAGKGSIVNFGSIWGGLGSAGVTAYCVSKGAIHQLTRALALDHVEQGIRVNAVAPGEVNTPMLATQRKQPPTPESLQALANATIPMKRLAEPEEIAKVVVFLASDDASYITGEIVNVDAGYAAR